MKKLRAGTGRRRGDPRALRRDLPELAAMLRQSYAGWSTAAKRGWNWPAFFRRWDRHLRRLRAPASTADLFAPWREFLAFQPDGHTGPLAPMGVSRGSQTLLVNAPAGAAVTAVRMADGRDRMLPRHGANRLRAVGILRDGGCTRGALIALPAIWGSVTAVRVNRRWLRAEPVPASGPGLTDAIESAARRSPPSEVLAKVGGEVVVRRLSRGVVYVRIPTLSANTAAGLRRLAKTTRPVPPGAILVVDLRGNRGGDHTAALALLQRLLAGADWSKSAPVAVRRIESAQVRALRWNFARLHLGGTRAAVLKPRDQEPRRAQEIVEKVGLPAPRATRRGTPRVLVLVDGRTGSDAELLVWILRRLRGTKVAGTCTFGAAQFIQPGVGWLPRSELAFCVATAETDLYGDGRPVDGHGLPVDLVLADAAGHAPTLGANPTGGILGSAAG